MKYWPIALAVLFAGCVVAAVVYFSRPQAVVMGTDRQRERLSPTGSFLGGLAGGLVGGLLNTYTGGASSEVKKAAV